MLGLFGECAAGNLSGIVAGIPQPYLVPVGSKIRIPGEITEKNDFTNFIKNS